MMSFSEIMIYNMKNQKMNEIGKVEFDFETRISKWSLSKLLLMGKQLRKLINTKKRLSFLNKKYLIKLKLFMCFTRNRKNNNTFN